MRNKTGIAFIVIGVLLIAAAGGLLLYNDREAKKAEEAAGGVLEVIQQELGDKLEENLASETMQMCLPENPSETDADQQKEMPVMTIDGYDYIGYLSIPSIDLNLPVMEDWDYDRLKISPCRHYGSIYSKDLVIAGHNYNSHFGLLKSLVIGDYVFFTDMDGICRSYVVADSEILEPYQIEEMKESPWDLTLYTCTIGGEHRVTIRCEETEAPIV